MMDIERYGYDFISGEFIPPGKDEYWLRNELNGGKNWRSLNAGEIEILNKNGNYCPDWGSVLVSDPFEPDLVRRSNFYGLVRLGALRKTVLQFHDFCIPAGIRNSTIISCDIGDDAAIQDCSYISHYIIGDGCILSCIDEMQATNHSKFGNGAIKDGEKEDVRVWIDVLNETGGRAILPFDTMIPADAYLWSSYRDDTLLLEKLKQITQEQYGGCRGGYGIIGSKSLIKSCSIIKDVAAGCSTYIKGANKLKNLTIHSSADEPTQIGEGVELVNGIVGCGCNIFYGSKAVRFVVGRRCNLKYGARLIHSVLGDNSTVSCCEILNNLIYPMHEQHHNNSFLIASLVQGMSNMAAGATLGSNHNSRANDGEIRAGRGFWPGLAVSVKHSSCFASFVIIAKGEYPSEMNIPLPFALLNNNVFKNRLEVMPAYFWEHNLYALERNSWKSSYRDRRKVKVQHIETDYLAPDTAEEIINAISLLEKWIVESRYPLNPAPVLKSSIRQIFCRGLEKSKRGQVILKPFEAIDAYRSMLRWYALKTIVAFLGSKPEMDYAGLIAIVGESVPEKRVTGWVNMGGQIVPAFRVDELRRDIGGGKYADWDQIHREYNVWQELYPADRLCHAWAVLLMLRAGEIGSGYMDAEALKKEVHSAIECSRWITGKILETRAKDFRNPYKAATFRNEAEMEQVLGTAEKDSFVAIAREKNAQFEKLAAGLIERL